MSVCLRRQSCTETSALGRAPSGRLVADLQVEVAAYGVRQVEAGQREAEGFADGGADGDGRELRERGRRVDWMPQEDAQQVSAARGVDGVPHLSVRERRPRREQQRDAVRVRRLRRRAVARRRESEQRVEQRAARPGVVVEHVRVTHVAAGADECR